MVALDDGAELRSGAGVQPLEHLTCVARSDVRLSIKLLEEGLEFWAHVMEGAMRPRARWIGGTYQSAHLDLRRLRGGVA